VFYFEHTVKVKK